MAETTSLNSKMSTAQLRKIKKPMIEKRRRCRINESLNQLKSLVLEALNKDESRYSKMEKADILEMTVKHLKAVQKQQVAMTAGVAMATGQDPYVKYRAGYTECAREIGKCLNQISGVSSDVQSRLLQHLEKVGQPKAVPSATPMTSLPGSSPFVISTPLGMTQMTQPLSVAVPPVVAVMSPAPVLPSSDSPNLNLNSAIPLYISPRAASSPGTTSPALSTTSTTSSRSGTPHSTCVHSPQAGEEVPRRFRDMCSPPQSICHSSELTRTSPIIVQPSLEVKNTPVWRPW